MHYADLTLGLTWRNLMGKVEVLANEAFRSSNSKTD